MKPVIVIATHKEYEMPEDALYLPLHVGKEAASVSLPFAGDNTGEHISHKNPYYCELTALYWAWKNLDADYIGLAHYRRHFTVRKPGPLKKNKFPYVLSCKEALDLLNKNDIILPKKRNYYIETSYSHYVHSHPAEPLDKTREIIRELFPDYEEAFHLAMQATKSHRFNMFLMKRDILDGYCEWLFAILSELENRIDASRYDTYNRRVFGFISERLLDVYLLKNNLKYKEIDVLFMENEHWIRKGFAFLKRKLIHK